MTPILTRAAAPKFPLSLKGLIRMLSVQRSRAHLALLDDRLLGDIGVTRAEAAREAQASDWSAPGHWKQ